MKSKYLVSAVFILLSLLCTNCVRDFSTIPVPGISRPLTPLEKHLIESDNMFGIDLFKEISEQKQQQNIFISPLSVAMALSMAYNGSAGSTEEAMRSSLNYGDLSKEEVNQSFKDLIVLLTQLDPDVQFLIANSIWCRQGFVVENQFIDLNKTYFNAEVRALDFRKPEAIGIINSWVDSKTNGKIKDVINYIDESTMLFLINAIYFKSNWTYEFNKNLTKDDYFNLTDNSKLSCKMMNQSGDISYFETSEFQAADLPYSNRQFHMSIFLPKQNISIDSVIAAWNPISWKIWISQFRRTFGNLSLPKFKLEYRLSLVNILKSMGMGIAFNPEQADFTNINKNGNLFIDEVLHKTYVNVDEEGTEAAAVTVVSVGITSIAPSGFVMRVDRPFVFVIWESQSNTILFLGKVISPSI